jgi:hypothetical protein
VTGYSPYQQMWCGECYTLDPDVSLDVNRIKKQGGKSKKDPQDQARLKKTRGNKHMLLDAFLHAQNRDHAMIPFECDSCVFQKLAGHSPCDGNPVDALLSGYIRRAILDVF